MDRGVYMPCSQYEALFVSAAHTEADIDATIAAATRGVTSVGCVEERNEPLTHHVGQSDLNMVCQRAVGPSLDTPYSYYRGARGTSVAVSFSPAIATSSSTRKKILAGLTGSLSSQIPRIAAPVAPMPVQTA